MEGIYSKSKSHSAGPSIGTPKAPHSPLEQSARTVELEKEIAPRSPKIRSQNENAPSPRTQKKIRQRYTRASEVTANTPSLDHRPIPNDTPSKESHLANKESNKDSDLALTTQLDLHASTSTTVSKPLPTSFSSSKSPKPAFATIDKCPAFTKTYATRHLQQVEANESPNEKAVLANINAHFEIWVNNTYHVNRWLEDLISKGEIIKQNDEQRKEIIRCYRAHPAAWQSSQNEQETKATLLEIVGTSTLSEKKIASKEQDTAPRALAPPKEGSLLLAEQSYHAGQSKENKSIDPSPKSSNRSWSNRFKKKDKKQL